ncbi:MAG: DHH family phosphoesterase [bacterium]
MREIDLKATARFFRAGDDFLILTHKRPDGDTLGSGAALCSALRRSGKRAFLLRNPEVTPKYAPFVEPYSTPADYTMTEDTILVAVDAASLGLFPKGFPQRADLCIDHHPSNEGYADCLLLDAERAACGEIILKLIELMHGAPTKEEADLLYVALSTDTGCFRYTNTDASAFASAARLAEYGADVGGLNILLFRTFTRSRMAIEALTSASMRSYFDGKLTVALVTREMIEKAHATQDDMDELPSLPGQVEGTQVSILIKENEAGHSKLSVRSLGGVDVSAICAHFGGGGHRAAAGCELACPPEEALQKVLPVVEEAL